MSLFLIHAGLAAVAFAFVLGLLLGGLRSVQVGVLAGAAWLGLVWLAWTEWGRQAGAIAAGMSLLYGAVALPLAGPAARSLFGLEPWDDRRGPPAPSPRLQAVSQALEAEGAGGFAAEALLDLCVADPAVRAVLGRYGASREWLRDQLVQLLQAGGGRWVGEHYLAASALAYPPALQLLLTREPGEIDAALARIAANLEYGARL